MAVPYTPARWPLATTTTVLWAAAVASAVFWGLRVLAPDPIAAPAVVSTSSPVQLDTDAVARILGAQPVVERASATPQASSRFQLLGVVADDLGRGAALISIDGKPARPYRAGAVLVDSYVLQSVEGRQARIGADNDGPALFTLQLPALPLAPNLPPRPLPPMES